MCLTLLKDDRANAREPGKAQLFRACARLCSLLTCSAQFLLHLPMSHVKIIITSNIFRVQIKSGANVIDAPYFD